jgi:hypothetical protein
MKRSQNGTSLKRVRPSSWPGARVSAKSLKAFGRQGGLPLLQNPGSLLPDGPGQVPRIIPNRAGLAYAPVRPRPPARRIVWEPPWGNAGRPPDEFLLTGKNSFHQLCSTPSRRLVVPASFTFMVVFDSPAQETPRAMPAESTAAARRSPKPSLRPPGPPHVPPEQTPPTGTAVRFRRHSPRVNSRSPPPAPGNRLSLIKPNGHYPGTAPCPAGLKAVRHLWEAPPCRPVGKSPPAASGEGQ